MNTSTLYYLRQNEQQAGPYTIDQVRSMWQAGTITAHTLYWLEGAASWETLTNLLNVLEPQAVQLYSQPPAIPTRQPQQFRPVPPRTNINVTHQHTVAHHYIQTVFCRHCSAAIAPTAYLCVQCGAPTQTQQQFLAPPKSRTAFVLLGIFAGALGIHNFYAGYSGRGAAQLLITVFLGWTLVPLFIVFIWNFVEICSVTRDPTGRLFA